MLPAHTIGAVRTRPGPDAGCGTGRKAKTEEPPYFHAPDGFLNHLFAPLIPPTSPFARRLKMERSFNSSRKAFSDIYGINLVSTSLDHYPNNLGESYNSLKTALKKSHPDLELLLMETEDHPACLATMKTYDTGNTLFYIPVENLYLSIRSNKHRCRDNLLLSALSYFLLAGGIPFYSEHGSYIGGQYEMISEWTHNEPDDWEKDQYKIALSDLKRLSKAGDTMYRRIANPANLSAFESRIKRYKRTKKHNPALLNTCSQIFSLFKEFGHRSIMDSVISGLFNPNDDERIYAEQYISFCWSDKGWIWEHLTEMVNSSFQECVTIEEPCSIRIFNGETPVPEHNLEFETRFFELLCNIIDHLIELS